MTVILNCSNSKLKLISVGEQENETSERLTDVVHARKKLGLSLRFGCALQSCYSEHVAVFNRAVQQRYMGGIQVHFMYSP